jgi:ParB-like nuclease domain
MPDATILPTQLLRVADLAPWEKNPRRINPAALARLYMSVDEYGLVQPLVVNKRTGHVVAGHRRLEVLKQHGVAEAPCIVVDWDPDKEATAALALNAPYGEFDSALLRDVLHELEAHEVDIDLTALPPFVIADVLAPEEALAALTHSPSSPLGTLAREQPFFCPTHQMRPCVAVQGLRYSRHRRAATLGWSAVG